MSKNFVRHKFTSNYFHPIMEPFNEEEIKDSVEINKTLNEFKNMLSKCNSDDHDTSYRLTINMCIIELEEKLRRLALNETNPELEYIKVTGKRKRDEGA